MINLLPDETKRQTRAARINESLIKCMIFLIISVIFLGSASWASYMFLFNSKTDAQKTIATNQGKADSYASVLKQANDVTSKLNTAKTILDQQVSYSKIITGIASVLPSGVVIDSLTLTNETLGTPLILKARAKTTGDVAELKANIQKSLILSNYNLQSLSSNPTDTTGYPVLISIGITINKSAAL